MKFLSCLAVCAMSVFLLLACSACEEKHTYKIGVSQCSSDDWREQLNEEIYREITLHPGVEVEIRSADDSSAKQIEDLRYFAANGFDIIIVSPNEAESLTPVIAELYEGGLPIVVFDRNIHGDTYTARLGADDEGLGRAAAHYALHLLGSGAKAIELYGLPGSTPAEGRHSGFITEFENGGGRVLASVAANWNEDEGAAAADSLLEVYPDVDLIFGHNDRMAIGASRVARGRDRRDIKIIGIDASANIGVQAVADTIIDATFIYPTAGDRIIRTALAILQGEPFEKEQILPASSAVDLSNADILLLQYNTIRDETSKIKILNARIDDYWKRYDSQTWLIYAAIAIILLLVGVVFLILRVYWQHRRHQESLEIQYRKIEEERDKQKVLNERLEEATQAKLVFYTNVSHDLRTPLTLIAEPVACLAEADNLTNEQRTLVRIANKNVRILLRLINQILDFRKYENDKMALNLTEVDLSAAVTEWTESFFSLASKRDVKLSIDIADDCRSLPLAMDIEKIERVFFNLLSNAFKYTPANGRITVRVYKKDDSAFISVADTGQGICERDLGNIFDRFYQVERVHPNGSGIGLSLSKAFVELHHGELTVDSTLNKGSVFTASIPITHVAVKAEGPTQTFTAEDIDAELGIIDAEAEFAESKPLVLVIDDNADIRQLLTTLLGRDYNVICASGGIKGLKLAAKYVPDLIICDVMMPGMDGIECCRRLKEELSTSHIPVLMLTACSMDEQRIQGYRSGADGYLSKPFNSEVLKSRCTALIENRKKIKELWNSTVAPKAEEVPARKVPDGAGKVPVGDLDNEFYNRFLEIFRAEMANTELSVDGMASRMGLERSQFYRKIKALTNYSPVELIRILRLRHGRKLLMSTEKTISEIAYATGFSTPAYFTKCFRDYYGEAPSSLRK